jgi:hypothetical protein
MEAAKVATMQSGGGLDLDSDKVSRRIFQNNIDLLPEAVRQW